MNRLFASALPFRAKAPGRLSSSEPAGMRMRATAVPNRSDDAHVVAFITEAAPLKRILMHVGEPAQPPPIAPARWPRAWDKMLAVAVPRLGRAGATRTGVPVRSAHLPVSTATGPTPLARRPTPPVALRVRSHPQTARFSRQPACPAS
jgi:hypothetical protein